jgi:hypothetical protein
MNKEYLNLSLQIFINDNFFFLPCFENFGRKMFQLFVANSLNEIMPLPHCHTFFRMMKSLLDEPNDHSLSCKFLTLKQKKSFNSLLQTFLLNK